ncbi:MAG TPA: urate oxidase [Candidatus Limnocylindria bacterium]|nr:urate oxidase [Candidatus Limnocylindria bacterium]
MKHEIRYGKAQVSAYRTYAAPLEGVAPIPESPFTGRANTLFGAEIEIVVRGEVFWDAYERGDNRLVVATDTMKNFIHATALACRSATLEGWLHEIGAAFLGRYEQMERITMLGRELPFTAAVVPAVPEDGEPAFALSDRLFAPDRNDHAVARLDLERDPSGPARVRITDHESGRAGLQLIKITGSAFADFARDEHTTLPERRDRPLHVWTDVGWRYGDPADALGGDPGRYVAPEQVADLAAAVFHEFVSLSIQHLVHEIGRRMLARWPQLAEVSFDAQNRLWDTGAERAADDPVKVYTDPRPPYGRIGLVLRRE